MTISYLHLDTLGQPYNTNSANNTFPFIESNNALCPNAYNVIHTLQYPLSYIQKIYLKAFETTILFPNIRATSKLNFINVNKDGIIKTIFLQDNTYTDIEVLINDLNTATNILFPEDGIVFSLSTDYNIGNLKLQVSNCTSCYVEYSNLGYFLGWRKATDTITNNGICYASYTYNLAYDTYISLNISNLSQGHTSNNNNIPCSFKIPIIASSNTVSFSNENLAFSQSLTITEPVHPITFLNIQIFDRFGYSLNAWGSDISITLALEKYELF